MSDIVRKMATVDRIIEIIPIENADSICLYKVRGWKVVARIGEYKVGDLIIYCEIDSFIPHNLAPFLSKDKEPHQYLGVEGERLCTIKLRGVTSQGLLLPISILDRWDSEENTMYWGAQEWYEGDDVADILNIQKYIPPVNAQLAGMAKGNFPHFIRKTDEERIQNIKKYIQKAFDNQDEFEVSLKVDGSSCTIYNNNLEFGVCSRNIDLKLDQEGNAFVDIAYKTGLLTALELLGRNLAVQGELMGPGIQGNRENLKEHQLYIFNIFDIDAQEYLTPTERRIMLFKLKEKGYTGEHVPVIDVSFKLPTDDIDELLKIAEGTSINHSIREGLVFKRKDGKFSFKIINNQFLVKEK